MAIYRGTGGSGDATADTSNTSAVALAAANAAQDSAIASAASAASAAVSETNAEAYATSINPALLLTKANNLSDVASVSTTRDNLGLGTAALVADNTLVHLTATETITNKTISLTDNSLSGTTAEFNTALSDGSFATLAGTETLTNKALNGSLGTTTPSTVAATTVSTSGNISINNASALAGISISATDTTKSSYVGLQSNGATGYVWREGTTPILGGTSGDLLFYNGGVTGIKVSSTGVVTAPSGLEITGDLTTTGNTILGNASTDTLNVGNGGLVKDASGNTFIGTAVSTLSADAKLGVQGAIDIFYVPSPSAYKTTISCPNGHTYFYANGDSAGILFGTTAVGGSSATTKMTLDASGGLKTLNTIGVGNATPSTSGAGITFPATQSASTDANTLDDYEEGTWTPSWTSLTVVGTPTYTGTYIKIGRMVYCQLSVSSTTSTASVANTTSFTGLPYVQATGPGNHSTMTAVNNSTVASIGVGLVNTSLGYTPTWAAAADVIISFFYKASA